MGMEFLNIIKGLIKMKIKIGNIWDYRETGYIVIPTNGIIKTNGENVMGRGLALQAKNKYPDFPRALGNFLKKKGNTVGFFTPNLITFPVKHKWYEKADLELIEKRLWF